MYLILSSAIPLQFHPLLLDDPIFFSSVMIKHRSQALLSIAYTGKEPMMSH